MVTKIKRYENLVFNNIGLDFDFNNTIVSLGVVNGLNIKINIKISENTFFVNSLGVGVNLEVVLKLTK